MHNTREPVGLLYCYSQEAVDGLKELTWDKKRPWQSLIRWWSLHATQEAYEELKYAHIPFNVVSEHRLLQGRELPWKVLIIPYVEHLHSKSRQALVHFMDAGGTVYVGANSTLDLPGIHKLPVAFDTKFTTWWPEDRVSEWNQRRVRQYLIGPFLEKADLLGLLLACYRDASLVTVDDPEVVYNVREAGTATYLFVINDHQVNPVSPEMRKLRQHYNHFMLMPMDFPPATPHLGVKGGGWLYPLLAPVPAPRQLAAGRRTSIPVNLRGGEGKLFLLLPEPIQTIEFTAAPARQAGGIAIQARILGPHGVINAALPVKIDFHAAGTSQTAYAATRAGLLTWTAPYLKTFPAGKITVTITDLASGKTVSATT